MAQMYFKICWREGEGGEGGGQHMRVFKSDDAFADLVSLIIEI